MSYKDLQNRLGYTFKDEALIELAITHKSFSNISNNERLEFLGDSILNSIISEYLFNEFGKINEGKMTSMRASLVNENSLYELAKKMKWSKILILTFLASKLVKFRKTI